MKCPLLFALIILSTSALCRAAGANSKDTADEQWHPQIVTQGVKNFVPNSSFECGTANWGSFSTDLHDWRGNLYDLVGELDDVGASHGGHSFKIALSPDTLPVFSWDYWEPVRQKIGCVMLANQGWFHVQPGEKLTLSAFLRGDADGLAAQMAAIVPGNHLTQKAVTVSAHWQRYEFTFEPEKPFLFIAIGLDLKAAGRDHATLWIDGIQLERGGQATAYEPRQPVEAFIETGVTGNTFTHPARGATFIVRAFNNTDARQTASGKLSVTDFFNRPVFSAQPSLKLAPHSGGSLSMGRALRGRQGFFRANWTISEGENASGTANSLAPQQSLRCAIIEPADKNATDSPLGFNHAFPWDFMVRQARVAGIAWWRDWSAQWQVVESGKGKFNFTAPDAVIKREQALGGEVDVLLPYPSAHWSTTATPEKLAETRNGADYRKNHYHFSDEELTRSCAPRDWNDFAHYAAEMVRHYDAGPRPLRTYQILNEPVQSHYALWEDIGYTVDDYIRANKAAYRAMKAVDPQCRILCGISHTVDNRLVLDFVRRGGLQFLDVLDLHMYESREAGDLEKPFLELEALMRAHGGIKPLWITEWGCYADDDPPVSPRSLNGWALNSRSHWPNERAATEHMVKFAAVAFAHGVQKIFFHAGVSGAINGLDGEGVMFEYGGTPRKIYPGIAAFTRLFGLPEAFVQQIKSNGRIGFVFQSKAGATAIAWSDQGGQEPLKLAPGARAYDIMGNELKPSDAVLSESPIYLIAARPEKLIATLAP